MESFNIVVASGVLPPPGYDAWMGRQVEARPQFSWANVVSSGGDCRVADDEFAYSLPEEDYECEVPPPFPFEYVEEEDEDDDGINVIINSNFTPPPPPLKVDISSINFKVRPPMVRPEDADLCQCPPDTDAYPHLLTFPTTVIRRSAPRPAIIITRTPIFSLVNKRMYDRKCEHKRMVEKCMSFFDDACMDEIAPHLPAPCGLFRTTRSKQCGVVHSLSKKCVRKSIKRECDNEDWYDPQPRTYLCDIKKKHDPILLAKLRAHRNKSMIDDVLNILESKIEYAWPQMDSQTGPAGDLTVKKEKSGNVELESQRGESRAQQIAPPGNFNLFASCGVDKVTNFSQYCGRWTRLKSFEWTTQHTKDLELLSLKVPADVITTFKGTTSCGFQPQIIPFFNNRYCNLTTVVKIAVNSNKFQVGQLQGSFYYCASEDNNYGRRNNIRSNSQRPTCLISAGMSNEGALVIPYRHYLSQLPTVMRTRTYYDNILDMARVSIRVLNPLITNTGAVSTAATVSIFVRFEDCYFNGMIQAKADAQMFTLKRIFRGVADVASTVESTLNQIFPDADRDNPPLTFPPQAVYQRASGSLCVGEGESASLIPLRLDRRGQTAHPPGTTSTEFSFSNITRTWGLTKMIEWTSDNLIDEQLFYCEATPCWDVSEYSSVTYDGSDCYYLPPVACVSQQHMMWRGSLEMRVDIIGSSLHTGRLQFAYIPGYSSKTVTAATAKGSLNKVFDLQEGQQILFEVPYIASRPWWPNITVAAVVSENTIPPGYVFCHVINKLIPMDAIAKKVYLNVYWRAGEDFELGPPCTPTYGLSFNAKRSNYVPPIPSTYCTPAAGYEIMFTTYYSGLDNQSLTFFWDEVSGHVTYWEGMDDAHYYEVPITFDKWWVDPIGEQDRKKKTYKFRIQAYIKTGSTATLTQVLYIAKANDCKYQWAYAFASSSDAKLYKFRKDNRYLMKWVQDGPYCEMYDTDKTPNGWRTLDSVDVARMKDFGGLKFKAISVSNVRSEIGENKAVLADASELVPRPLPTGYGLCSFGESFSSVKAACRRFNRYARFPVSLTGINKELVWSVNFPVRPCRMHLDITDIEPRAADNLLRDGYIANIMSAFRFYRGSVKFAFLFSGNDVSDYIVIQHRPNYPAVQDGAVIRNVLDPVFGHDIIDPQYPMLYQNFLTNACVTCEVPWYGTGDFTLLQPIAYPKLSRNAVLLEFGSNGNLFIAGRAKEPKTIYCDVLYALGDDASPTVFCGFPPMLPVNEPLDFKQDLGSLSSSVDIVDDSDLDDDEADAEICGPLYADPQGISDYLGFGESVNQAKEVVSKTPELLNKTNAVLDRTKSFMDSLIEVKNEFLGLKGASGPLDFAAKFMEVVDHLVYCIISPCWPIITWCVVSIVGIVATYHFKDMLKKILNKIFKSYVEKHDTSSPVQQDSGETLLDTDVIKEVKNVVGGVLAGFGIYQQVSEGSLKDCLKNLFKIDRNIKAGASLVDVVNSALDTVSNLYDYISNSLYSSSIEEMLSSHPAAVKLWALQSATITSPDMFDSVDSDPMLCDKVFELDYMGSYFAMLPCPRVPEYGFIRIIAGRVRKLAETLMERKKCSPVRFEPFVLWLHGEPGVGKSYVSDTICIDLLRGINYRCSEAIYTRTCGNQYWNGLKNQPILKYDDFLQIQGDDTKLQAGELFSLKTCASFNPPMAAVSDKNINYNPLVVCAVSNTEFPVLDFLANNTAFNRRRDCLVRICRKARYRNVAINDIDDDVLASFGHLEFFIHNNVVENRFDQDLQAGTIRALSYAEFKVSLLTRFTQYYANEHVKYMQRCNLYKSLRPEPSVGLERLFDKYKKFMIDQQLSKTECRNFFTESYEVAREYRQTSFQEEFLRTLAPPVAQGPKPSESKVFSGCLYADEINTGRQTGFFNVKWFAENSNPNEAKWTPVRILNLVAYTNLRDALYNSKLQDTTKMIPIPCGTSEDKVLSLGAVIAYGLSVTCRNENLTVRDVCADVHTQTNIPYYLPNDSGQLGFKLLKYSHCPHYDLTTLYELYESARFDSDQVLCYWGIVDKLGITIPLKDVSTRPDLRQVIPVSPCCHKDGSVNEKCALVVCAPSFMQFYHHGISKCDPSIDGNLIKALKAALRDMSKVEKSIDIECDSASVVAASRARARSKSWKQWFEEHKWVKKLITCVGVVLGIVGSFLGCKALYNKIKGRFNTSAEILEGASSQIVSSGDAKITRLASTARKVDSHVKAQSVDVVCEQSLIKKIVGNTVHFLCYTPDHESFTFKCVVMHDRSFVYLTHFFERVLLKPGTTMTIIYKGLPRKNVTMTELHLTPWMLSDGRRAGIGIGLLPDYWPLGKDLTGYLLEQDSAITSAGVMVEPTLEGVVTTPLLVKRCNRVIVNASDSSSSYEVIGGYTYNHGGSGKCGSIIIGYRGSRPYILGMHTAGSDRNFVVTGHCEALNKSDFKSVLDVEVAPEMADADDARMQLRTSIVALGKANKALFVGSNSRIVPSEIHGVFDVHTYPAPLSGRDSRIQGQDSPLLLGCEKQGVLTLDFPDCDVESCEMDIQDMLNSGCKPIIYKDVLSIQDSINGLPFDGFERMEMNTSEGYPWILDRPKSASNKKWLFTNVGTESDPKYVANELLLAEVERKNDMRENGVVPFVVFADCLKDSRLKKEKCSISGKTRVFNISPVDATISYRQYFLTFCASYSQCRFDCENMIGINVDGWEWKRLRDVMLDFSPFFLDGDYSNFGPSLNATIVGKSIQNIMKWYEFNNLASSRTSLARVAIGEELRNSVHICHDLIYQTLCGSPSGCALTVYVNSLVNSYYVRLAFLGLAREHAPEYYDLSFFTKFVKVFVYGDDLIMSVKPQIIDWYNNVNIAEYFAKYNINYTSADKGDKIIPYKTVTEVSFLKRKFVDIGEYVLAELDVASVEDCVNWVWKSPDIRESTLVNCRAACELAYGRGKEEYVRIVQTIRNAYNRIGVTVKLPTWEELHYRIWSKQM